jgi:hypothetical protein
MNRTIGVGFSTLAVAALLATATATPAQAGSKGRKNTTAVLGAVAAYELLKGNTTAGVAAGAGAVVAYGKYKDARDDERRYDRYRYSDHRYDRTDYYRDNRRDDRSDYRYDRSDYRYDRSDRDRRSDDRDHNRYSDYDRRPSVYQDGRRYDSRDRSYYLDRDGRRRDGCDDDRGNHRR